MYKTKPKFITWVDADGKTCYFNADRIENAAQVLIDSTEVDEWTAAREIVMDLMAEFARGTSYFKVGEKKNV